MHFTTLLALWIHFISGISIANSILERPRQQRTADCRGYLGRFHYPTNEYRNGIGSFYKPGFLYKVGDGSQCNLIEGRSLSHSALPTTYDDAKVVYRHVKLHSAVADDAGCEHPADAVEDDINSLIFTEEGSNDDSLHGSAIANPEASDDALATPFVDASDPDNVWYERELIDKCKSMAIGGRGGNGCVSFRREKHVPLGGADGGNGGPGGSVYLICDETVSNLNPVKQFYVYKAENGKHGCGERQNGAKGRHRYIRVPPGTHVYSLEGELYAVLQNTGDRLMVVRGGRGGKGNRYYKSKFNVAPKICEMGEEGITREVILNYKLVGNVALVGKPNSGKSSMLRCLSNARPRVADYAFSTKFPIVGVMDVNNWKNAGDDDFSTSASSDDNDSSSSASTEDDPSTCASSEESGGTADVESSTEEQESSVNGAYPPLPNDNDLSDSSIESELSSSIGYLDSDLDELTSDYSSDIMEEFDDSEEHDEYASLEESYKADNNISHNMDDGDKYLCVYGYRSSPQLYNYMKNKPNGAPRSTDQASSLISSQAETIDNVMQNIQVKRVSKEGVGIDKLQHVTDQGNADSDEESYTEYGSDEDDYDDDSSGSDDTNETFETVDDLEDIYGLEVTNEQEQTRQLVIADVPGLIEGASEGRGLGHKFLKHIENCNVLAYVVDASVDNPLNDYMDVRNEIGLFNKALLSRLDLILLNKIDLIDAERATELLEMLKNECEHDRVYTVSAKTRDNIETVKVAFAHIYQDPIKKTSEKRNVLDISIDPPDEFRRLNPRRFKVEKIDEGEFRIKSSYLERKIPMMRFDQRETLDKLRRILRINRIHYKLKRMGVKAGDVIHIGEMSFCVNELAY